MSKSKRRSDHGTFRASERDLYLLRWIGDQFAVNTEQLKILMNRWKRDNEPAWQGESISDETVKWLINRWRKAGWAESHKLLARKPAWVWVSKGGLKDMGLPYPEYEPAVGRLDHIYHVSMVRLYIEKRRGDQVQWISERQVNVERKKERKGHVVDGEVVLQNTVIGIEVEQTQKSKRDLASIVRELRQDYEVTWYFVHEKAREAVREAISRVEGTDDLDKWRSFVIYPLDDALI